MSSSIVPESKSTVVGAAPEGASDQSSAALAVREMFTSIAPRYDLLNHVLSFNIDRMWWRRTARAFPHILVRSDARILDLCCGTGEMTFALRRQAGKSSPQDCWCRFLSRDAAARDGQVGLIRMPRPPAGSKPTLSICRFACSHFDLVTSAFGFRNLADYDAGLREIFRVLRPGGECGILDFGEPKGVIGRCSIGSTSSRFCRASAP